MAKATERVKMIRRKIRTLAVVVIVAAMATACGGDETPPEETPSEIVSEYLTMTSCDNADALVVDGFYGPDGCTNSALAADTNVAIESEDITGDSATVKATSVSDDDDTNTFELTLTLEDGRWLIEDVS